MEIEVSSSTHDSVNRVDLDSIRVKRKTLQNLLEDCQRALELLNLTDTAPGGDGSGSQEDHSDGVGSPEMEEEISSSDQGDPEADKLYDLIKSRVEGHDFREKIELAQVSLLQDLPEDGSSWDVVSEDDVWGEGQTEDDYVLVREEDIADGIACFMATYLSSLKQTKDISPDQLQKGKILNFHMSQLEPKNVIENREYLAKMLKRKGKLRKAWEGSKVIYNVASWSATAIGIYQNPMILSIASKAFWVSCKAISKLV